MKRRATVIVIAATLFAALFSVVAEESSKASKSFRSIPIPKREHGYSNMQSMVIQTQAELDAFLQKAQEQGGWNNRKGFVSALNKAGIDFSQEALVFMCHMEGSGSTQVNFAVPRLEKNVLKCTVSRKESGMMGTADMAYYCFSVAVSRSSVQTVELHIKDRKPIKLPIAK